MSDEYKRAVKQLSLILDKPQSKLIEEAVLCLLERYSEKLEFPSNLQEFLKQKLEDSVRKALEEGEEVRISHTAISELNRFLRLINDGEKVHSLWSTVFYTPEIHTLASDFYWLYLLFKKIDPSKKLCEAFVRKVTVSLRWGECFPGIFPFLRQFYTDREKELEEKFELMRSYEGFEKRSKRFQELCNALVAELYGEKREGNPK